MPMKNVNGIDMPLDEADLAQMAIDAQIMAAWMATLPMPMITARQLRLALRGLGITAAMVEAALNNITDEAARDVAMIEWEYATTFPREHPLIAHVGGALGLTETQIDEAWRQAAVL